jgi:hypothetical protein
MSIIVGLCSCEPATPAATPAPTPVVVAPQAPERADACRRDIPDCEASCALRETNRTDYIDWFDRRCAAVILGKNPDKAVGQLPPDTRDALTAVAQTNDGPGVSDAGAPTMPTTRQLPPAPLDPFAGRNNNAEPAECTAARTMRAHGKIREADVLAALCSAKGGSETKDHKDVDLGF